MFDDRASLDSSTTKGNNAEWFAVNFALSRSYGSVVCCYPIPVADALFSTWNNLGPYVEEMWIQRHLG
jgi:hypothetical protein